jgi:hypothetical protein
MNAKFLNIIAKVEKKYPEKMKYVWHIINRAGYAKDKIVVGGCENMVMDVMVSKIPETRALFGMVNERNGDSNIGTRNDEHRRLFRM